MPEAMAAGSIRPSGVSAWPEAGIALLRELSGAPGRIVLVEGAAEIDHALDPLAEAWGEAVVSAGRLLTESNDPPTARSVSTLLAEAVLIDDAEILFTPELALDPLALLRDLSRRHPAVMCWPGKIREGDAFFSEPGRRDHYQQRLSNAVILRPVQRQFPDQHPYLIDRIP